jgi:septal ring factor EnvC (AmiA/AmiB activator)
MTDDRESREVRGGREFKQTGDDFRYSSILREIASLAKTIDSMESRFVLLIREMEARADRRMDEIERRQNDSVKAREDLRKDLDEQEKKFIALDKELKPIKAMALLINTLVATGIIGGVLSLLFKKGGTLP